MSDNMFELTEVGIAVEDLDAAIAKFEGVFGVEADPVHEFDDPRIAMRFSAVDVGHQRINLLQPLGDSGPVGQAIKHRGEGFFNVFFQVDDIEAAIERIRAAGLELVEPEPRVFPGGSYRGRAYESNPVAWIHPRSFHGLLVEVQEYKWAPGSERDPVSDDRRFQGIPEIGVAVNDLAEATAKFEAVFGVEAAPVVEAPVPGVEMRFNWIDVGAQRINLYEAMGDGSPIARKIKRSGEGLFNIMLLVDDVEAVIEPLQAAGVQFVEPEPRVMTNGKHGGHPYDRHRVMWIHPRSFHGIQVEIQDFDWAQTPA